MPPKKINFRVVNASSEDEKFPSADLNSDKHGPLVLGWTSQKFCNFPVYLIVQFDKRITLKKVQLLSHQYLIASKVEFYIGDCVEGEINYQTAKYTRLGYVELSTNERTDYKARELKSVHLEAEGTFLKFVLHKNFVNKLNMYNQVGLVALNIIGIDPDEEINYPYLKQNEADPVVLAAVKRPDYISPLDDLAFAMYQDSEISSIIRELDKKKSECVLKERYDEAKRLKQAISELYKIGERLARYEIEKRQAIEEEDYERAKQKKEQINEYRAETYKQLQQNNLLDLIDPQSRENLLKKATYLNCNDSVNEIESIETKSSARDPPRDGDGLDSFRMSERDNTKSPAPGLNSHRPSTRTDNHKMQIITTSPRALQEDNNNKPPTPYEDRVIPTLRNTTNKSRVDKKFAADGTAADYNGGGGGGVSNDDEQLNNSGSGSSREDGGGSGSGGGGSGGGVANDSTVPDQLQQQQQQQQEFEQEMYDPIDGTEEMTEREVREAALMNDYLGKQIVTKLYSKNFQNREDALQEIYTNLSNYSKDGGGGSGEKEEAKSLMRASAILVAKMCNDNVYSIFQHALKLLQFLLTEFARRHSLGKAELNYVIEKALPVLLHRTGDTNNARLRQRAHEYIVEMASLGEIKPLHTVPHFCTIPINLHIAPRLALSRVEIVEDLMKSLGTQHNGLTVDMIAKFCSLALEHTSGEVRELATKLIIQIYKLHFIKKENGNAVRRYLPQDNEMNRRNKKYRILFDAFDTIDGKPIRSNEYYDRPMENSNTPRFSRNIRTPNNKSKTNLRATSLDRKTPTSMADESEFNADNTCMFCGEVNEKFVKQGFEVHYWKSCPMLKQCNECKQVIEIAVQNDHLLTECQHKIRYKKCPRCSEAVNVNIAQENEHHFKNKQCLPFDKRMNRCPLCHTNIASGEEAWREHLKSPAGCTKNPRRRGSVHHTAVAAVAATAPDMHKKSTSSVGHHKK